MISIIWHESGHAPVLSIAVGEMHVTPGVAEDQHLQSAAPGPKFGQKKYVDQR